MKDARARTRRWPMITAMVLGLLALGAFGLWRWAVASGSAGTLEWIDARFPRGAAVELAAQGRYGPDPAQRAELWVPAGQTFAEPAPATGDRAGAIAHPLVVFVHGGGWHSGAPEHYRFVARTLGEAGFATALVGYRLVPEGRYPAMLNDTAAGIRWSIGQAAKARVRGDRIALAGHSAGAYNVLMMGLDPQWLADAGVPESAIGGIVSMAGPTDFYPFTSDSARAALGHVDPPQRTQPIAFTRAGAPPILLLHGTADTVVRVRNARRLGEALRRAGAPVEAREYEGMGHAGIIMALSKPFAQGGIVREPMIDFLRRATAPAAARGAGEARPAASVPVQP
ncbi:alpha/beta hydrolase fold domain-containing protein [Altererythrobacter aerius]|uniref:Alpha/beta hydrolase fold domain-containing protein n=1 Tax=Tsuneonella aeria TaxID=1837929 RepID=A0A6I4TFW5_9SPHN|nr:alpha/beta hydrolase [Tsuneonella aeria]MXO75358.1 alpha/beta hydrolase fold domain-containing protein [Tsuneonella aeria]